MKFLTLLFIALSLTTFAQVPDSTKLVKPPPPAPAKTEVTDSDIVDFPDVEADFKGGTNGLQEYIIEHVRYPKSALKNNQHGKVYLSFIVEKNGSISNIKVEKSSGTISLDSEAIRLLKTMPKWKPAKLGWKKVRTRCRLPIIFTLS